MTLNNKLIIKPKKNLLLVLAVGVLFFIPLLFNFSIVSAKSPLEVDYSSLQSQIVSSGIVPTDEDWYEEKINMIIIVRDQADEVAAMQQLADWKTEKGVPTRLVNQSEYSSYDGRDVQERIRNCIKAYYINYSIEWVLLAGDVDLIPIREVYNPDTVIVSGFSDPGDDSYKPTDMYYADLTGTWDTDGDGIYGESKEYSSSDEIDWVPEVYVGRFPGQTASELSDMVTKTINYENVSASADWMNSITLAGAVQKAISESDPDGEEESYLVEKIVEESIPNSMDIVQLFDTQRSGYTDNLTNSNLKSAINDGNSIVYYAGHGGYNEFSNLWSSNEFLYSSDAISMSNDGMPSLFYADACLTNQFDYSYTDCIGEELIKNPTGGAIGFIGGMRLTWFHRDDTYGTEEDQYLCEMNRGMSRLFFQEMFLEGNYQQGKALYEMKEAYVNSWWLADNPWDGLIDSDTGEPIEYNIHVTEWERKNVLTYNLLGDPETDIYTGTLESFDQDGSYGGVTGIFTDSETYYQGQMIRLTIQDTTTNVVSNALVCVQGEDGAYQYYRSDSGGNVNIKLPQIAQNYTFTVSAHNMIPLKGSFTVESDTLAPIINSVCNILPENPSVDDNVIAKIEAEDLESGVSEGFLIISTNNFESVAIYTMTADVAENTYSVTLPKLDDNNYQFIVFVKDYADNYNHTDYESTSVFEIPFPVTIALIIAGNIGFFGIMGLICYKKRNISKDYERKLGMG